MATGDARGFAGGHDSQVVEVRLCPLATKDVGAVTRGLEGQGAYFSDATWSGLKREGWCAGLPWIVQDDEAVLEQGALEFSHQCMALLQAVLKVGGSVNRME
jgi:hypothetical protein